VAPNLPSPTGVGKSLADTAVRSGGGEFQGAEASQNVHNSNICSGCFRTVLRSSDRWQYSEMSGSNVANKYGGEGRQGLMIIQALGMRGGGKGCLYYCHHSGGRGVAVG
jgi:hypothetical protein